MKGFVYSLDAAISVILFVVFISALAVLGTNQTAPKISNVLIGSDIISALDMQGVLETLDTNEISNRLGELLPANMDMSITLNVYDSNLNLQETKQVNTDLTGNHYSGKWLFIVGNITDVENFVSAEYKVGLA